MHTRNQKAKWALIEDKPLAESLVSSARRNPEDRDVLPKFQAWLDDINAQLATFPEE